MSGACCSKGQASLGVVVMPQAMQCVYTWQSTVASQLFGRAVAKAKGPEGEGGNSGTPAEKSAAESVKGGTSPTAAKAKNPGGKAGAQKRGKQKPAQGAAAQPQKPRPAGQKSVDITCQPSDAAATIQLSPAAAPLQPLDSEQNRQAVKGHAVEKAPQNAEGQKAAERKEGPAKTKAAKRKASKAPEPVAVPQLTRLSSSSLSGRVSPPGPPSDRNAEDRIVEETASQSGAEEAARSEPITQTATPVLTPNKPGMDAEPCASQPGLIRLSNSPLRGQGRADFIHSKPPPLESLMPMAGPEQHHVKVCDSLLAPCSTHWTHVRYPSGRACLYMGPFRAAHHFGHSSLLRMLREFRCCTTFQRHCDCPAVLVVIRLTCRPSLYACALLVESKAGFLTDSALQDASAEDLLLALLRASASAKEGRSGSAAPRQPASEAVQPAKDGSRGLRDALPYLAAHANSAPVRPQQVRCSCIVAMCSSPLDRGC